MHAEPDLRGAIERPLWRAMLRQRARWWLASIVPALATLPASVPAGLALLVAAAGWAAWDARRWRRRTATQWPRWLDDAVPALEDSSGLLAAAPTSALAKLQRARLAARLTETVGPEQFAAIARAQTHPAWLPLTLATVAAIAVWLMPGAERATARLPALPTRAATPVAASLTLQVKPPAYTGVQAYATAPRDLQVPRYSVVHWCAKDAAATVQLGDGTSLSVAADTCAQWRALEALSWRSGAIRHDIRVIADQPPTVTVAAPTEAVHQLAPSTATVRIAIAAWVASRASSLMISFGWLITISGGASGSTFSV